MSVSAITSFPSLAPLAPSNNRHAVLIGAKALDVYRQAALLPERLRHPPSPYNLTVRYNNGMNVLETLLAGHITIPGQEQLPQPVLDNLAASAEACFGGYVEAHQKKRQHLPYSGVVKIAPYFQTEMREAILSVLSALAKTSRPSDQTLIYYRGHGGPDGLDAGLEQTLSFKDLLSACDQISGKKALILSACYSGNIIPIIQAGKTPDNYAVIASTETDHQSTTWNDDSFEERVFQLLAGAGHFSDFDMNEIVQLDHDHVQIPTVYLGHDPVV